MRKKKTISIIAKTHQGRVREQNEDRFVVIDTPRGSLLAIADGMGGANAGEVAAETAISAIKEYLSRVDPAIYPEEHLPALLKNAVLHAHRSILERAFKDPALEGMGTTLIVGWTDGCRLSIAWSGDSRCYHYRRSAGLRQLSKDHSYVQMLVDEGLIGAGETFLHPLGHIITQSLGDRERAPEPGTAMIGLTEEDTCLFCSDGLNSMLTDIQIEKILQAERNNLARCIDTLIEKANEYGGEDNITIILSKYRG
jgi:PPM family protein phosphatase